jgi:RNA-binding protein 25
LITPANKPQGFGFAEFEDPDGALRAMALLNNVELPALEDGCVSKKLLVRTRLFLWNTSFDIAHQIKADEKTKIFLDAYQAQRMQTNVRRHDSSDLTTPRCSPYGAYMCPGRMTG